MVCVPRALVCRPKSKAFTKPEPWCYYSHVSVGATTVTFLWALLLTTLPACLPAVPQGMVCEFVLASWAPDTLFLLAVHAVQVRGAAHAVQVRVGSTCSTGEEGGQCLPGLPACLLTPHVAPACLPAGPPRGACPPACLSAVGRAWVTGAAGHLHGAVVRLCQRHGAGEWRGAGQGGRGGEGRRLEYVGREGRVVGAGRVG